ncbi:MAG: LuxR C-terminal-related transcriptional regulator [Chryseolinea sp.]
MRELWEVLSILPSRIDFNLLEEIEPDYPNGIEDAILSGVIVNRNDHLTFKHELFRIAIEESLSRYRRKALHSRVLKIMLKSPTSTLAQLVHHARSAEDKDLVLDLAPKAGKEASSMGAHVEAARFYQTGIDFASNEHPKLPDLYSSFAYECYLTNQIDIGVMGQEKALALWRERKIDFKIGDALRFLSRLTWFSGERVNATQYGEEAIAVLENGMPTRELALAYSNLSQLNMLHDHRENTIHWGQKAIDLAEQMNDPEILSHALNNVGSISMKTSSRRQDGIDMLQESLSIALKHGLQEHAARAFTNRGCFHVLIREYSAAREFLDAGLKYCEDRDLLSWYFYLLGEKTRLLVDTGHWNEAEQIAISLRQNPENLKLTKIGATVSLARIKIRHGEFEEARQLIEECKILASTTGEAYRVMPVIQAELELCWTTKQSIPEQEVQDAIKLLPDPTNSWHFTGIAFWMRKCEMDIPADGVVQYTGPFKYQSSGDWLKAAEKWKSVGCLFECALTLMEGDEEHQRQGLTLLDQLGATATSEMLKGQMRDRGMRNIPRGPRESTRSNPAQLTTRQIEILLLLKNGAQNKQIADKLFISSKTVDHHISAILSKLEVKSRNLAVAEALKLGILK